MNYRKTFQIKIKNERWVFITITFGFIRLRFAEEVAVEATDDGPRREG